MSPADALHPSGERSDDPARGPQRTGRRVSSTPSRTIGEAGEKRQPDGVARRARHRAQATEGTARLRREAARNRMSTPAISAVSAEEWWVVPSLLGSRPPSCLRQIHTHPRVIANLTNATSTDTVHRMRMAEGVNPLSVGHGFLQLDHLRDERGRRAQLRRRQFLELEPSEAEELPVPDPSLVPEYLVGTVDGSSEPSGSRTLSTLWIRPCSSTSLVSRSRRSSLLGLHGSLFVIDAIDGVRPKTPDQEMLSQYSPLESRAISRCRCDMLVCLKIGVTGSTCSSAV